MVRLRMPACALQNVGWSLLRRCSDARQMIRTIRANVNGTEVTHLGLSQRYSGRGIPGLAQMRRRLCHHSPRVTTFEQEARS
jgi:hypothetical protein